MRAERNGVSSRPPVTLGALLDALKRPFSGSLLITRFFFGLAFAAFQTIFSLYALLKFNLNARDTGFVLAYVGVLSVITQGFLVGWITRRVREDILILVSAGITSLTFLGWAFAPTLPILLLVMLPNSMAVGMLNTLLSSTLTKAVAPHEVGGILGLSASIESSTRIIAPTLGGYLLQQVGTWAPGLAGAVIMVGVTVYVFFNLYNHPVILTFKQEMPPVPQVITD